MQPKILVDTSVIIDFIRQKNKLKTLFFALDKNHDIAISIITHTELYSGKSVWEDPARHDEIVEILSFAEIILLNKTLSSLAGKLRSKHGLSIPDAIIASTAIHHKMPLATINIKDFEGIEGLTLHKSQ